MWLDCMLKVVLLIMLLVFMLLGVWGCGYLSTSGENVKCCDKFYFIYNCSRESGSIGIAQSVWRWSGFVSWKGQFIFFSIAARPARADIASHPLGTGG